jgi:hypothetical protein
MTHSVFLFSPSPPSSLQYFNCLGGTPAGGIIYCSPGTLFDVPNQSCDWANQVECIFDDCQPTPSPTSTPTTAAPTVAPSSSPTDPPPPTVSPTTMPSPAPSPMPSSHPTLSPQQCCASGYSGLRAWQGNCSQHSQQVIPALSLLINSNIFISLLRLH